jgi:mono/diheme cytochrome c family protein
VRVVAPLLLALALAALASGCGQTGVAQGGDVSQGKQLFVSRCGGCHRLQDAGTQGQQGPDLDGAFAGVREQGFRVSTIKQVVYDQIYHAAAPMPQKLVTGSDAASVAAYIASVAGTGPAKEGAAPTLTGTTESFGNGGNGNGGGGGGSGGGGGTSGGAAQGANLFESYGCSSCHSLSGAKLTGPPLNGLSGSKVTLSTGQSVTADDAYLLESILDPDAKIVQGFPKGIMSATIRPHSVPQAKANALVAFIKSKK